MGEEGFSSDSSLLYHRSIPSTIVDSRDVGAARPVDHAEPPAAAAAPASCTTSSTRDAVRRSRRRHRPPARARQRRRAHLVCGRRRAESRGTATGSATSASTSSAAGRGSRRCSARSTSARATTSSSRGRRRTDGSPRSPAASRCARTASRPTATSRRRSATSSSTASSSSTRRTASATCARPAGPLLAEDVGAAPTTRPRSTSSTAATGPGGVVGTVHTLPFHPLDVVGWDGCLYPYVFNVARLRADHRPHPPAAAGAPGLRGLELRHLQLRAAQGRLPPAVDPGALLPLQRRQRRDHVLRRRRLRGAQGVRASARARSRCTPAATRTARSPARPRARSASSTSTSWPSWSTRSARSSSARPGARSTTATTRGRGPVAGRAGRADLLRLARAPAGRAGDTSGHRRTRLCRPLRLLCRRAPRPAAPWCGRHRWIDVGGTRADIRGRGARGASEAGRPRRQLRRHHAGSCWRWRRSAVWAPPRWPARHPPVRTGATAAAARQGPGEDLPADRARHDRHPRQRPQLGLLQGRRVRRRARTTTSAWPRSRPWSSAMRAGARRRAARLMLDAGDTIQGTPLAYYYAKIDPITERHRSTRWPRR